MNLFDFQFQIWKRRQKLKLSQRQMAERLGITQQAYSEFEREKRHTVTLAKADAIVTALGGRIEIHWEEEPSDREDR